MPSPACSEFLRRVTAPWVGTDPAVAPTRLTALYTDDGGRLVWIGPEDAVPPALAARAIPEDDPLRLSPALTEHHVHGGDGVDLSTSDAAAVRAWLQGRRATGIGQTIGSLPALSPEDLAAALDRLRPLWEEGLLAGLHLEGPFLAPARAGAHPPALLCAPDSPAGRRIRALLRGQPAGYVRTLTLAPELPGALALVRELTEAGVVPCPGHTDADAAQTEAFLAAAAPRAEAANVPTRPTPVVTHLFNAMRPFHHRTPGPIPVLLAAARAGRIRLELIGDGVHVDPGLVALVLADPALAAQTVLISDGVAATDAPHGTEHRLGGLAVHSVAGAPRLAPEADATLAGGATGLTALVGRLLAGGPGHGHVDPDAVLRAATHVPAQTLPDAEEHASGDGDVLVWGADGTVRVLRGPMPR